MKKTFDLAVKECNNFYISKEQQIVIAIKDDFNSSTNFCYDLKECGCQVAPKTEIKEVYFVREIYPDAEEITREEFIQYYQDCLTEKSLEEVIEECIECEDEEEININESSIEETSVLD